MGADILTILAVDDQPGVRYLLDAIIKEEGFVSHLAANGAEAVEKVPKILPDLIFMDLRMPVMDGKQAIEAIDAMDLHPEVVVMTAFTEKGVIDSIRKKGDFKYLNKPFDVEEVRQIVRAAALRKKAGAGET